MQHTLMYLCFGRGKWSDEAAFSVLSATRHPLPATRIVVVTEPPDPWKKLPVTVEAVSEETLAEWAGPQKFIHRRKLLALHHVIDRYGTPTVYVDGDTYFTQSPELLFERIGPSRSVMHLREGTLGVVQGEMHAKLHQHLQAAVFRDRQGVTFRIPADAAMWNAGVVGLHPSDLPLVEDAIHLCDQLTSDLNIHTSEMFALSWILSQRTTLSAADDIVFHYWLPRLRKVFEMQARGMVQSTAGMEPRARAAFLWPHRPRPTQGRRARNFVRDMLRGMGLFHNRLRGQG